MQILPSAIAAQNKRSISLELAPNHEKNYKPKEDRPIPTQFFWKTPNPTKPPDQMEEIKNMMQTMMKEIVDLKAKVHGQ